MDSHAHVELTSAVAAAGDGGKNAESVQTTDWSFREATMHPMAAQMLAAAEAAKQRREALGATVTGGGGAAAPAATPAGDAPAHSVNPVMDAIEVEANDTDWTIVPFIKAKDGAGDGAAADVVAAGGRLGYVLMPEAHSAEHRAGANFMLPEGAKELTLEDVDHLHPYMRLRVARPAAHIGFPFPSASPLPSPTAAMTPAPGGSRAFFDTSAVFGYSVLGKLGKQVQRAAKFGTDEAAVRLNKSALPSWWALEREKVRHMMVPSGSDSTNMGAAFNLANSIVGAGILGLALFMMRMGYVMGPILLALMAALMGYMVIVLVRVGVAEGCDSYGQVVYAVFGKNAGKAMQSLIVATSTGSLIAYVILIGDFVTALLSIWLKPEDIWRRTIVCAIMFVVVFPLVLRRDLNGLRNISFLSVAFVIFFVVGVFVRGAAYVETAGMWGPQLRAFPDSSSDFFGALPVATFAFACAPSAFPIYQSMQKTKQRNFDRVVRTAYPTVLLAYGAVGLFGYLVFGNRATGNILKTFSEIGDTTSLMALVTFLFMFTIMFTFPLVAFTNRISLHFLAFGPVDASHLKHFGESVFIVGGTTLVGITVSDVSLVFGFAGALGSASICLTVPALLALYSKQFAKKVSQRQRVMLWAVVAYGLVLTTMGLVSSFEKVLA